MVLLFIAPALFASNMLVARATADTIPPVALAFWRWSVTLAIVLPMTAPVLWRARAALRREWRQAVVLGALGMGVCGGGAGLHHAAMDHEVLHSRSVATQFTGELSQGAGQNRLHDFLEKPGT